MRAARRRATVVLAHDYPPMTGGGLALDLRELAELVALDHDAVVLSSRLRDHFADDRRQVPLTSAGVRYERSRATGLVAALRGADLAVAGWTFSCRRLATAALVLGPLLGTTTVCVVFTAPEHRRYNRLRHLPGIVDRAFLALLGRAMRRCAAVVALGPSHRAALEAAGVPVTHVLPLMVSLPVGPSSAPPGPRPGRRAGPARTIGVAGELSALKGSERLPALFEALTPEFAFRVAGGGPMAASLQRHRDGLPPAQRDEVALLGPVPPEAMGAFYASIDVLLLTSRTEAQPRVVLEAMQAGVVVAGPPVTGVVDAVVDGVTGVVVDVDDPESCRRRLAALVADPESVDALRRRAREHACGELAGSRDRWRRFVADALDDDRG